jgi:hypothetical protein
MINDLNSGSKQRLTSDQTRKNHNKFGDCSILTEKKIKTKQNKNIRKNNTQGTENN